jgi:DNA-binding transcriptional MerR regulator
MGVDPSLRSIGQVLASLKGEFSDISISKIRFLESVGLVSPQRAPSGYRRYTADDVERLRYILRVQKSHYLPLKVIREHLDLMDRGLEPPRLDPVRPQPPSGNGAEPGDLPGAPAGSRSPTSGSSPAPAASAPVQPPASRQQRPVRLSREDLLEASGLTESTLAELESIQVVVPRRGTRYYGREALAIAVAARRLAVYGIDSRHLRAFKLAADREIGLVEQAIAPHVRRGARQGRDDVAAEVTQLVIGVHAALIRTGMEH